MLSPSRPASSRSPTPTTPRLTLALFVLLVVHVLILPVIIHRVEPAVRTARDQIVRFAAATQSADSWEPMAYGRDYAVAHRDVSLYGEVFFRRQIKFMYPPTSLLFIHGLSRRALNVLSWTAVWVAAIVTVLLFRRGACAPGAARKPITLGGDIGSSAIVLMLALTFYPLLRAYTLGQIQVWLDALFALFVLAWWGGYRFAAGLLLGVLCLIKPPFAVIAVWAAVRGDGRLLAGAATSGSVGLAVSIAAYGLASHLDYPRVLSFLSHRGEVFYANQSMNGLLNRLLHNGDGRIWQEHEFPPANTVVYLLTLGSSLLLVVIALVAPIRGGYRGSIVDLAVIGLVSVLASPIAWEHHYGIVLPLLGATTPLLVAARPFGRYTGLALAASYLLVGEFVAVALLRYTGPIATVMQCHVLGGALLLLVALLRGGGVLGGIAADRLRLG